MLFQRHSINKSSQQNLVGIIKTSTVTVRVIGDTITLVWHKQHLIEAFYMSMYAQMLTDDFVLLHKLHFKI